MGSREIRKKFLDFFQERGHSIVPSSSLIPNDPSLLLTTAGMQQFKPYFTGELNPISDFGSRRTTSIQKCFRINDLEEIGDNTHLSFFEMLGNFSFGPIGKDDPEHFGKDGYFKKSAIIWAYQFITKTLDVEPERISVSIFGGYADSRLRISKDEESRRIWLEEVGIPAEKITGRGREDNFWGPTGSEGPCGPTTEIYIDGVEVWNLVFNEYYCRTGGGEEKLEKLENPGVDTGMGLERLTAVLENQEDVFSTDLFQPITSKILELTRIQDNRLIRIQGDHLRAASFLIADSLRPENKGAGYILRRLLRRILAYQIKYDIHQGLAEETVKIVSQQYSPFYPELRDTKTIVKVMEDEEAAFQKTITKGLEELNKFSSLDGSQAFHLYETFGLPFELIKEFARPETIKNLNREEFEKEFITHQEKSRQGAEKKFGGHGLFLDTGELKALDKKEYEKVVSLHTVTHLLHQALRDVLGQDTRQMGSDITAERTRFDFSFDRKVTETEIQKIENIVNDKIKENLPVSYVELPKEEAEKTGAIHLFNAKYPDKVKIYSIGLYSKEFCNGPHTKSTGLLGKFKIVKEESVAAGVRRIKGVLNSPLKLAGVYHKQTNW